MAAVKRTPIDDLQTVIKQNIFIQYALIVPVVATFIWLFGFYSAWGSIFVVALGYSVRLVASEKKHFYSLFSDKTPLTRNKSEIQHCAWLNLLLKKYWTTCVPKFVEPQIEKVNGIMLEKKPGFMKKLEIGSWQMGDRAPRITQIYTPVILSEDRFEMQFEILFVPDLNAEVHVQPHEKILLKVLGSEIKFKAKMKLSFYFNDLFPECSIVGIEFMENPLIELSVRPTSKLDLVSAPFVYQLIQEILKSNLGPMLVTPNRLQFTLGGGQVETYELMEKPITDIIIIYSETSKAPPGYFLLQRTCSGMLAANLNAGNEGKHLYICYSRDENKQPITAVCVMYPRVDIKPPQGFEVLLETPSAEPASLNIGNKGEECFLCISRAPGAPITGLALVNESEDYILPEDFKILELSVTGHKANLNKKTIGDRLFLAFKGGYDSFFGYPRVSENPAVGTLRVELIEAKNLIAADITGTSDPYAELIIGEATPKKGSLRKISSVVDKTLDPQWKENFVFTNVNVNSILTVNIYDKDAIEINPELIGRVQLPLNDLVIGKPVKQWVPLQMVSHGEVLLSITALDFGHPADQDVRVIKAIDPVSKYSANGLMGNLAGVGGMGIKGIKGVANFGAGVGGMGVKGVTNVGEMGLKGVTNVGEMGLKGVTNVGEMGMKGVTNVGEMGVKGVTNVGEMGMKAVTGLFGSRSRSKKSINVDAEGNEKPKEKKEKSKGHKGLLTSKSRKKTDPPTDAGKESKQSEPEVATIPENKVEPAENSGEASVEVSRQPIVREGVLEKHSNMIKKLSMQSKKRFCVLKSEAFNVFKSQKDFTHGDSPHESFPLGMVTINQSKSLHSFDLIDAKHHHHTFKCASDEDLQLWMSALTNNKRCLSDVQ